MAGRQGGQSPTPISLAVIASLCIVFSVLLFALAVAGSYYLSIGAIKRAEATQAYIAERAQTLQIRQAIPTCHDIVAMDNASHIASGGFPPPPHNGYDLRLSAAIHRVSMDSHCPAILADVAKHMSYSEILRQIRGG